MGSICAEQHNFHSPHQLFLSKKTQRAIDIPPRKYLTRRPSFTSLSPENSDFTLLQKFLPYNNTVDDDDTDPYTLDEFRMYQFKIRKCTRSRSHDWTDCPFVHPGEKARRRDPRRFNYSGTACTEFRRGGCSRGDECEYAHGVFECWLHPTRYRTEACKDGKNCKRKVCFFAHTPRQLRLMPLNTNGCVCCHHSVTASPTSILSPPLSPAKPQSMSSGFSPISRFGDRLSYKDKVIELMSSLEAMNVSETVNNSVPSWADEQHQFILSPTIPSPTSGHIFIGNDDDNGLAGPDLGWVNDLLT